MKMIKILFSTVFMTNFLFGLDITQGFPQEQQQQLRDENGQPMPMISMRYPLDVKSDKTRFSNPQINRDRFELNISPEIGKRVAVNSDRYTKIVTETIDVNLLIDTLVRQIRSTDVVNIHPHFLTTINFPEGTEIIYVNASIPMDVINFSANLLTLQPTKDFVNGNILVTYNDGERTYYTNLIIQKYSQVVFKDNLFNRYVIDDNFLSVNYRYVRNVEFNPIDILKKYIQLNGENILKTFAKEGDHDVILVDGVSFYITRDSAFGQVDYKNMRFAVSQNYSFADKSMKSKSVRDKNDFYPEERAVKGRAE